MAVNLRAGIQIGRIADLLNDLERAPGERHRRRPVAAQNLGHQPEPEQRLRDSCPISDSFTHSQRLTEQSLLGVDVAGYQLRPLHQPRDVLIVQRQPQPIHGGRRQPRVAISVRALPCRSKQCSCLGAVTLRNPASSRASSPRRIRSEIVGSLGIVVGFRVDRRSPHVAFPSALASDYT